MREDGEGQSEERERKKARREGNDHQTLMATIRMSSIRPFRHYCCCWLFFSTQWHASAARLWQKWRLRRRRMWWRVWWPWWRCSPARQRPGRCPDRVEWTPVRTSWRWFPGEQVASRPSSRVRTRLKMGRGKNGEKTRKPSINYTEILYTYIWRNKMTIWNMPIACLICLKRLRGRLKTSYFPNVLNLTCKALRLQEHGNQFYKVEVPFCLFPLSLFPLNIHPIHLLL